MLISYQFSMFLLLLIVQNMLQDTNQPDVFETSDLPEDDQAQVNAVVCDINAFQFIIDFSYITCIHVPIIRRSIYLRKLQFYG